MMVPLSGDTSHPTAGVAYGSYDGWHEPCHSIHVPIQHQDEALGSSDCR